MTDNPEAVKCAKCGHTEDDHDGYGGMCDGLGGNSSREICGCQSFTIPTNTKENEMDDRDSLHADSTAADVCPNCTAPTPPDSPKEQVCRGCEKKWPRYKDGHGWFHLQNKNLFSIKCTRGNATRKEADACGKFSTSFEVGFLPHLAPPPDSGTPSDTRSNN